MAAADRTNNTELQRFISNLRQHQQKNVLCDLTLTTDNVSIACHKLVLSSVSSYFSQLLCDSDHNINIIDVTPLPEHILRTVVAYMYNGDYVIDDGNVPELFKLSMTWNLDILSKLCVAYIKDHMNLNNVCTLYNIAADNVDQHCTNVLSKLIREHFTSLHELGQLSKLSLKNFTTIIEHDNINVKNEDVIFSSAVQIINQHLSVEDINRCLKKIRFPHTSDNFLEKVIRQHPLMVDPSRAKYIIEANMYRIDKTFTPEVKPPRYWGRDIYYIGKNHCLYQYGSPPHNMAVLPDWVDDGSSVASHKEQAVIVGRWNRGAFSKRALLLDMTDNTQQKKLPNLPASHRYAGVVLSDDGMYVVGGSYIRSSDISSVYYLSFGSDRWQLRRPLPYKVISPLVIQHQQSIYVLGGYTNNGDQSSVSQYSITDDTWEQCSDIPVSCTSNTAGVVVHTDRITVVTVDRCLMYNNDTDTWTCRQYNKLGYKLNAFVRRGQIWATVWNIAGYRMMHYDDVHNVWKTEHVVIENAWNTRFFC